MGILECVVNNPYAGDGTVHHGTHFLNIKELCELFKLSGIHSEEVKIKYSLDL